MLSSDSININDIIKMLRSPDQHDKLIIINPNSLSQKDIESKVDEILKIYFVELKLNTHSDVPVRNYCLDLIRKIPLKMILEKSPDILKILETNSLSIFRTPDFCSIFPDIIDPLQEYFFEQLKSSNRNIKKIVVDILFKSKNEQALEDYLRNDDINLYIDSLKKDISSCLAEEAKSLDQKRRKYDHIKKKKAYIILVIYHEKF